MDFIQRLNKAFDSRLRLGIMAILSANDWVEFNRLKELLKSTDGNLASHIAALEKLQFIEIKKQFVGKKPQTLYRISRQGKKAFADHLNALEKLLKNQN